MTTIEYLVTREQVEKYVEWLVEGAKETSSDPDRIRILYRAVRDAELNESYDTLNDSYQIASELLDVFTRYAMRYYGIAETEKDNLRKSVST